MSSDEVVAERHWDRVHRSDPTEVSWYQPEPVTSLELMDTLGVDAETAVIDVGAGASTLVDELLRRQFRDVTVLDISGVALEVTRRRLGADADRVHWLQEDLRAWTPSRRYGLWHDRAVFHFLVDPPDQDRYRRLLAAALDPGGAVVIATFSPAGPTHCSGLPVARHSAEDVVEFLGPEFELVEARCEEHITPSGVRQPFVWVAARQRTGLLSERSPLP